MILLSLLLMQQLIHAASVAHVHPVPLLPPVQIVPAMVHTQSQQLQSRHGARAMEE
jgi:hypothetical protein